MQNEFESKAIIEKHITHMIAELSVQDDHDFGWIGDNAISYLTEMVFNTMALSSDAQKYMEKQDLLK